MLNPWAHYDLCPCGIETIGECPEEYFFVEVLPSFEPYGYSEELKGLKKTDKLSLACMCHPYCRCRAPFKDRFFKFGSKACK